MTVRQLIEKLRELDGDLPIVTGMYNEGHGGFFHLDEIEVRRAEWLADRDRFDEGGDGQKGEQIVVIGLY